MGVGVAVDGDDVEVLVAHTDVSVFAVSRCIHTEW